MSNIKLITFIYTKYWLSMRGEDDNNDYQSKELCRVAHQYDPKNPTFRATFLHNSISGAIYSYTQTVKAEKALSPNLFVHDYDDNKNESVVKAFFTEGKNKTECNIDGLKSRKFVDADEHLFDPATQDEPTDEQVIVTFLNADANPFIFTVANKYTYTFTRQKCIDIVKELRDGKWHKMKKPTPLFQNNVKIIQREKKNQRGSVTKEQITKQGDHSKFCEKHLESNRKGKWHIVAKKDKSD